MNESLSMLMLLHIVLDIISALGSACLEGFAMNFDLRVSFFHGDVEHLFVILT